MTEEQEAGGMSVEAAALYCAVSRHAVERWIDSEQVRVTRKGRRGATHLATLVSRADVERKRQERIADLERQLRQVKDAPDPYHAAIP